MHQSGIIRYLATRSKEVARVESKLRGDGASPLPAWYATRPSQTRLASMFAVSSALAVAFPGGPRWICVFAALCLLRDFLSGAKLPLSTLSAKDHRL